jgi:hypothetical protein
MPADWEKLPGFIQAGILQERKPGQWHLITSGPAAGNSHGVPSTPPGPARSPGHCGHRCASPRSTWPGSTTMPDSAANATPPTATSTGTRSTPGTAGALAATARALTRTGSPPASRGPEHRVMNLGWTAASCGRPGERTRTSTHPPVRDKSLTERVKVPVLDASDSLAAGSSQRATSARAVLTRLIWSDDELRRVAVSAREGGAGVCPGCR